MSIYWDNVLLKRLKNLSKKRFKCKINTDIGRFYFYFQQDKDREEGNLSGKVIFFPNKDFSVN